MSDEILVAIISLASAAIATYLGAVLKFRKDIEYEYDKDLREKRISAYQELWKRTEPLAEYSTPSPVTYLTIKNLSATLREWYFEQGGIFLSESSRHTYFALQTQMKEVLLENSIKLEEMLKPEELGKIKVKSHNLHKTLTDDIGSRMKPKIGSA